MATFPDTPEPADQSNERFGTQNAARVQAVRTRAPRAERQPRYGLPFFPTVPFGTALYILATVIALFWLATHAPAPLQNPADPLNHEKVNPRPEWYFLFLFQILKVFQGSWELVGTLVIPGLIGVILLGLPFYDRNWSRRASRRPIAVSLATLTIVGLAVLTYLPIASTAQLQGNSGQLLTAVSAHPKWTNISAIFAKNCQPCHVGYTGQPTAGLDLGSYQGAIKGGGGAGAVVNGAVIKPGNANGSYLWQVVAWRKDLYKVGANMPLAGSQISKVDQTNIANWINDGAKGP